eukprot:1159536-Pelagomonas_calceolata.AAC.1
MLGPVSPSAPRPLGSAPGPASSCVAKHAAKDCKVDGGWQNSASGLSLLGSAPGPASSSVTRRSKGL